MILFLSEICRLILGSPFLSISFLKLLFNLIFIYKGFLEEEKFLQTYKVFLNESTYLEECRAYIENEVEFSKKIHGKNLKEYLITNRKL